jgi:membrane-associated protein
MAVVAAIVFAESGLLIGFFLPGDSMLFTAGFLINVGVLNFNIHLFVALVFVAAVLGDGVGYMFGKRVGRRLFNRPNSLLFRQENVQKAEEFYEKHGGATVILARFIPVVRTFVPIIAGVGKMSYRTFLTYNIIGALLWAAGISYIGYYVGALLHKLGIEIDTILLPVVLLIILLSVLPPAIHVLKDKKQRDLVWNGTKKQIRVLLRKK